MCVIACMGVIKMFSRSKRKLNEAFGRKNDWGSKWKLKIVLEGSEKS